MLNIFKLFHKKSEYEIELDLFMAQIEKQQKDAIKEIKKINKVMEELKNDERN